MSHTTNVSIELPALKSPPSMLESYLSPQNHRKIQKQSNYSLEKSTYMTSLTTIYSVKALRQLTN